VPQRTVTRPGRLTRNASQDGTASSAYALVLALGRRLGAGGPILARPNEHTLTYTIAEPMAWRERAHTCPLERALAPLHDAAPPAWRGQALTCLHPNEHMLTHATLYLVYCVGGLVLALTRTGTRPLLP